MLGFMASTYFQKSPLLIFPLIALGLFMVVFAAITMRTLFTRKEKYTRLAHMPLEDSAEGHHE